jgi:hypothetical protein
MAYNSRKTVFCLLSLLAGIGAGCSTPPPPPASAAPAEQTSVRYVGDRITVSLQEVIASVAVEGAGQPYQNLHVELAAVINPVKTETYSSQSYSTFKVEDLVRRLGPRISSEVLKTLCEGRTLSPKTMGAIRSIIVSRAQDVVSQALSEWKYAADFSVEILITTMYLTDPSVGKTGPLRSW